MATAAPRLDPRIRKRLERLARSDASFAEVRRELVRLARELDVPPPSYEHIRRLVTLERVNRDIALETAVLPVLLDVAIGREHGNELLRVARGGKRHRRTS